MDSLAACLSSTGKVLYTLKTPYRDGTTQVAFDPVDFIARLAALVPKPRINLTRYHGVLAPNHRWRGEVTPAICSRCGGSVKVIVEASNRCIEEQDAIDRILAHLREKEQDPVDDLLILNTSDDSDRSTAAAANFNVDIEYSLESLGRGDSRMALGRCP